MELIFFIILIFLLSAFSFEDMYFLGFFDDFDE